MTEEDIEDCGPPVCDECFMVVDHFLGPTARCPVCGHDNEPDRYQDYDEDDWATDPEMGSHN